MITDIFLYENRVIGFKDSRVHVFLFQRVSLESFI